MQTLAGFLTHDDPGFPMLMVHMKELNKVKILCNSVGANASTPDSTPKRLLHLPFDSDQVVHSEPIGHTQK